MHTYIVLCLWFKEPIIKLNAADADVNTEYMLRMENQQLRRECQQLRMENRSQLALVQSPEGIMETQPTPAQLTGMLSLILLSCVYHQ